MTVSCLLLLDLFSHVYVFILFIVRRHGKDIIPAILILMFHFAFLDALGQVIRLNRSTSKYSTYCQYTDGHSNRAAARRRHEVFKPRPCDQATI